MTEGLPAHELSDEELERQGLHAHATRNWVFLHGTVEQFRTHTARMLELEQEYLRRHPKRTWQGSGGATDVGEPLTELDRITRIHNALRRFVTEMEEILADVRAQQEFRRDEIGVPEARLLARIGDTTGGRMHKLEAHQAAREVASDPRAVARLYKHDPPLLTTDGDDRVITDAGRRWLAEHPVGR